MDALPDTRIGDDQCQHEDQHTDQGVLRHQGNYGEDGEADRRVAGGHPAVEGRSPLVEYLTEDAQDNHQNKAD